MVARTLLSQQSISRGYEGTTSAYIFQSGYLLCAGFIGNNPKICSVTAAVPE